MLCANSNQNKFDISFHKADGTFGIGRGNKSQYNKYLNVQRFNIHKVNVLNSQELVKIFGLVNTQYQNGCRFKR